METEYCYVGIKACGCMVAVVYDDPEHKDHTADAVARFVVDGYRVERLPIETSRSKLGRCKCVPVTS